MPPLAAEPYLFPDEETAFADEGNSIGTWWVMHVRARSEKALARHCCRHQLSFFLPLCEQTRRRHERRFTSRLPLFPGYLFLRGNPDARRTALESNLVVSALEVADQRGLTRDLDRVHRLMLGGRELSREDRLNAGDPVEIVGGPLAGLTGRILRRGQRWSFIVQVDFLQQGASIEIDRLLVRPLQTASSRNA